VCTILLAWRHVPGAPVVLAANRDEFLERPSLPPHVLRTTPLVAGGQDALAGGTWLAVRADGTVAAVTNRRSEQRDPTRRSRGELPLALLDARTDQAARAFLERLRPTDYNPFNALYVSPGLGLVAHAHGDAVDLRVLDPGLHVLTVHDLDDRGQAKVDFLARRFAALPAGTAPELLDAMEELLRDHGEPGRDGVDAACVHGDLYGTVSSSSVSVDDERRIVYRHAPGRPCVTPHTDVSELLDARTAGAQSPSPGSAG
jgi:uncharacterized protein with NRDE domain